MRAKEPAPERVDRKKRGPPRYQPPLTLGPTLRSEPLPAPDLPPIFSDSEEQARDLAVSM